MKQGRNHGLAGMLTVVMLLFVVFMAAYTVLRARMDFQLDDLQRSLETSQGRERKQQYEYDEVVSQLPVTRAELAKTQPLAEEAVRTVNELKAERKRLRAKKKEMEEAKMTAATEEVSGEAMKETEAGPDAADGEAKKDE